MSSLRYRGEGVMDELREAFVGIDVAKLRNVAAVADGGRTGEVKISGRVPC